MYINTDSKVYKIKCLYIIKWYQPDTPLNSFLTGIPSKHNFHSHKHCNISLPDYIFECQVRLVLMTISVKTASKPPSIVDRSSIFQGPVTLQTQKKGLASYFFCFTKNASQTEWVTLYNLKIYANIRAHQFTWCQALWESWDEGSVQPHDKKLDLTFIFFVPDFFFSTIGHLFT